ncbi:hypothetical protein B0A50_08821 [Salinomyces thailandicus]|uniref:Uncharacterized protein n=2 Tax=Salinomyces thailandicus TaxID=706561 RepID=A0A4U0TIT6_9PEZI|nr:hypothetical protein B0A50_08821 [Salinomyces thailandica]
MEYYNWIRPENSEINDTEVEDSLDDNTPVQSFTSQNSSFNTTASLSRQVSSIPPTSPPTPQTRDDILQLASYITHRNRQRDDQIEFEGRNKRGKQSQEVFVKDVNHITLARAEEIQTKRRYRQEAAEAEKEAIRIKRAEAKEERDRLQHEHSLASQQTRQTRAGLKGILDQAKAEKSSLRTLRIDTNKRLTIAIKERKNMEASFLIGTVSSEERQVKIQEVEDLELQLVVYDEELAQLTRRVTDAKAEYSQFIARKKRVKEEVQEDEQQEEEEARRTRGEREAREKAIAEASLTIQDLEQQFSDIGQVDEDLNIEWRQLSGDNTVEGEGVDWSLGERVETEAELPGWEDALVNHETTTTDNYVGQLSDPFDSIQL